MASDNSRPPLASSDKSGCLVDPLGDRGALTWVLPKRLRSKTAADRVLEMLADRSGGQALFPGNSITLRKSF